MYLVYFFGLKWLQYQEVPRTSPAKRLTVILTSVLAPATTNEIAGAIETIFHFTSAGISLIKETDVVEIESDKFSTDGKLILW